MNQLRSKRVSDLPKNTKVMREEIRTYSVQFSRSVMSDSLRPHESQHARPPCPSQTPGVYSNSCPSSRWCHPAISSSVVPFSSCPQSLPASGSFPMSHLFVWGGNFRTVEFKAHRNPDGHLVKPLMKHQSYGRDGQLSQLGLPFP